MIDTRILKIVMDGMGGSLFCGLASHQLSVRPPVSILSNRFFPAASGSRVFMNLKINQAFRCTAKNYKVSSSCDSLSDIAGPSQGDHIHLRSQFEASSSGSIYL